LEPAVIAAHFDVSSILETCKIALLRQANDVLKGAKRLNVLNGVKTVKQLEPPAVFVTIVAAASSLVPDFTFRRFENSENMQFPLWESDIELLNIEPGTGVSLERSVSFDKAQSPSWVLSKERADDRAGYGEPAEPLNGLNDLNGPQYWLPRLRPTILVSLKGWRLKDKGWKPTANGK
jgi:hypothetical protein